MCECVAENIVLVFNVANNHYNDDGFAINGCESPCISAINSCLMLGFCHSKPKDKTTNKHHKSDGYMDECSNE